MIDSGNCFRFSSSFLLLQKQQNRGFFVSCEKSVMFLHQNIHECDYTFLNVLESTLWEWEHLIGQGKIMLKYIQ